MGLTHDQIQAIKQTSHAVPGEDSRVILFGSRADDTKKGGDIDLLFETDHAVGNRATTIGALNVSLIRKLGDRKILHPVERCRYPRSSCASDCTTNRHSTMSLKYLPEHAQATLLVVGFARKEGKQLRYSQISPCA